VSQAIFRLEQWYGRPLLEHEKRSFVLTVSGKEFYQKAKNSFEGLRLGLSAKELNSKSLKIGLSASLLELTFPKLKDHLKSADEPILKFGTTSQLMSHLANRAINIAIVVDNGEAHPFKSYKFHSGHFQILSKSGNFEACLITTEDRPELQAFKKFVLEKKIQFKSHLYVESWSVSTRLAQFGLGCCLVPDFISVQGLKNVRLNSWKFPYSARVLVRNSHELSPLEDKAMSSCLEGL